MSAQACARPDPADGVLAVRVLKALVSADRGAVVRMAAGPLRDLLLRHRVVELVEPDPPVRGCRCST